MSEKEKEVRVEAASVSDRGLSEKRPLNEDSYFADAERRIFAVADGVGGANAGEVASQTAVEVLNEAFRHNLDDADIEDLMELAIQRANASIHRMAQEQPKFAMMATTVAALHLDGRVATIGHVGDSRVYRLTPDGRLLRETVDHSVVEEEVRAGRMTAAQAANHPSRNVISRALGAEEGVDVDLKTIEVEEGTTFLLCSDGITRHLSDDEIRELLSGNDSLDSICEEMKRRCYERGAEDNLTAVIVRVGTSPSWVSGHSPSWALDTAEDENTVSTVRPELARTISDDEGNASVFSSTPTPVTTQSNTATRGVDRLMSTPQAAGAATAATTFPPAQDGASSARTEKPRRSIAGSLARGLFFLILLGLVGVASFFGGKLYQQQLDQASAQTAATAQPATPQPLVTQSNFAQKLGEVDTDPSAAASRMGGENGGKPLESTDPEFLYLYGRALLLSGNYEASVATFEQAVTQLNATSASNQTSLKADARFALAAAALKYDRQKERERADRMLNDVIKKPEQPAGSASPAARP
ncbi:MAG TPA: PP2C family serine/threonine-protein phosphatase [Pyrinomonadaceae bacterium]